MADDWIEVKARELSELVEQLVHSDPHQGRKEFLAKIKEVIPKLPFQVVFTDLIPCDMLFYNFQHVVVFMSIDYRNAGRYVVYECDIEGLDLSDET
jgi:hypothetical protein